jgi:hypothetical protein
MKTSPNVGLNIPEGSDIFNHDTFLKQNFEKIDNYLINTDQIPDINEQLAQIATLAPAPNGVDDTTVLQSLFAGGNKKILFPHDGQYIISSTINLFSDTTVEVKGNVEFFLKANSPCYMFVAGGTSYQNIKWTGGTINGNDINQGTESGANFDTVKGMVFKNVKNLSVQGLTVKNTRGHGINHWNCDGVVFRDIQFDQSLSTLVPNGGSRRDGITGMSSNLLIDNISGFTDDDLVAVLCGVDWAGTNTTPISVSNIEIRNVKAKKHSSGRNPWNGVAIYASGGYSITNIKVDGVYGDFNSFMLTMGNYDKPTRGSVFKASISNIYGEATISTGTSDFGMIRVKDVTVDQLIVKNVLAKLTVSGNTKKHLLRIEEADIAKLILDKVSYSVQIPLTDFIAILNEYSATSHNIGEVEMSNVSIYFSTTYTNGILFYKNNVTAQQTVFHGTNISIPAPSYTNNGSTFQDTKAVIICGNQAKIIMKNRTLPVLNSNTYVSGLQDGDIIYDPQIGELIYQSASGKLYVNNPKGTVTTTTYLSFDATMSCVLVDGTSNNTYFRIQDLQDTTVKSNFKNGFTIKIKRLDNNLNSHPYIKMTSGQLIDGTDTIYLAPYQTVTLQYWNGTWYKEQNVAATQSNSAASDVATLKTDFNNLLQKLKDAGLMS